MSPNDTQPISIADIRAKTEILPIILSGGSGTRLWPVSRRSYPKQLHPLVGENSLLQQAALRVAHVTNMLRPVVICSDEHRFFVADQLRQAGIKADTILLEPVARNTAPAAIVGALVALEQNALALMMPSDHIIEPAETFAAAVEAAAPTARAGHIVAFGIKPSRPETGYGYIRIGETLLGATRRAQAFIEKPDVARAKAMLTDGHHLWNAGILLFDPAVFLEEAERLEPRMVAGCRLALSVARKTPEFVRLDAAAYHGLTRKSVDYAILEHTNRVAVLPLDIHWSDVGSWAALWEVEAKDNKATVTAGDVCAIDTERSYLRSDGVMLGVIGVRNLVVVAAKDAVLVAPIDQAQRVQEVAEELARRGRPEAVTPRRVLRPWGWYETVDEGDRFLVKRLMVEPKAALSLQLHHHRSEHWIVVHGTARVTRGDEEFLLHENESTFIPPGTRHRLANPGKLPLHLIEVQSGSYLAEDDIVRFEDNYGRME